MNTGKLVFILIMLGFAGFAQAHTGLASSSPANGEVVGNPVHSLSIHFSAPVRLMVLKITDEAGTEIFVETGSASAPTAAFELPLASDLGAGSYLVDWTILGADGHLVSGDYKFGVGAP